MQISHTIARLAFYNPPNNLSQLDKKISSDGAKVRTWLSETGSCNVKNNQPVTHQCLDLDERFLWWHTGFPSTWSSPDLSATLVLTVEQSHHTYVPVMHWFTTQKHTHTHAHAHAHWLICLCVYRLLWVTYEFVLNVNRKTDGYQQSSQVVMMLMFLP